jgi:preprotein translocase subunit SecB
MEEKYRKFISGLDIEDIYLTSAQFKRLGTPDPEKCPDVKITFTPGQSKYRQKGGYLSITQDIRFLLEEIEDEESKTHKIFELKGQYALVYSADLKIDAELFELFKRRNIPVNLHPYVRELVQSTLVRVGLPPFTLPVLKLNSK